jgi:hypothetical protein
VFLQGDDDLSSRAQRFFSGVGALCQLLDLGVFVIDSAFQKFGLRLGGSGLFFGVAELPLKRLDALFVSGALQALDAGVNQEYGE